MFAVSVYLTVVVADSRDPCRCCCCWQVHIVVLTGRSFYKLRKVGCTSKYVPGLLIGRHFEEKMLTNTKILTEYKTLILNLGFLISTSLQFQPSVIRHVQYKISFFSKRMIYNKTNKNKLWNKRKHLFFVRMSVATRYFNLNNLKIL